MSYPSADQPGVSSKHVTCSASRLFYRARRYRTAPPRVSRSRSRDRRGGLANPVRVVTERSSSYQRARRTTLTQVRVVALFDQHNGRVSDERAAFYLPSPAGPAGFGVKRGEEVQGGACYRARRQGTPQPPKAPWRRENKTRKPRLFFGSEKQARFVLC